MKLNNIKDLYIHQLKDLHSAEKQLTKALPKMARAACSKELQEGFKEHLRQTETHVERLESILASHDQTTRGPVCKGMEGIIEEGAGVCDIADDEVRDAALIAAAQCAEHYEISGYGTARTYAELVGDKQGARILQTTLEEEAETDKKLTRIAEGSVNVAADK